MDIFEEINNHWINIFKSKCVLLSVKAFEINNINARELTLDFIEKVICKYFNLTPEKLNSNTNKREIVQARQIAMYFSKILTKHSLAIIGKRFANRDHATVLHACKNINNLIDTDKDILRQINEIEVKIKSFD